MREYGRVHSAFWSSDDIQKLSDDAKLLALYLLSCSHGTIAGVCRLPDGYVSEDLKWTSGRVSKGFEELLDKGFANRCETTKWVWIRKFLQWNAPENPNQWKAVWKVVGQIPGQCAWRSDFLGLLSKLTGKEPPPESNPSETVPEPFRNLIPSHPISTAPQQQQELIRSKRAAARPPPAPEFARFKLTFPARAGSQPWVKALHAINARIAEGHSWEEIIAGAERYAAFITATGKLNTEFTMQAARFVGPEKPFLDPWKTPATKAETRLNANISAAEEFMRRTEISA